MGSRGGPISACKKRQSYFKRVLRKKKIMSHNLTILLPFAIVNLIIILGKIIEK